MTKVTIIRHGQSESNVGIKDEKGNIPTNARLTHKGKIQASKLDDTFDLLILSPLKRSMETYINSNIKTGKIIISDLFREQREKDRINHLEGEDEVIETTNDVRRRAKKAINFIKNLNNDYKHVGIISHALFMWYFLEQNEQETTLIDNCQSFSFDL